MYKVGDVLKVIGGRRGDRYRVISIDSDGNMILRNIRQTDPRMNFSAHTSHQLELDKVYYRRQKLEKIMDNIDSFNILENAKETAEIHKRMIWLRDMEIRKRKIQKICSRLKTGLGF